VESDTAPTGFQLQAGEEASWAVTVVTEGGPDCATCAVEQDAELAVEVSVPAGALRLGLYGPDGELLVERSASGGERILLRIPVFEDCETAPDCSQVVRVNAVASADSVGSLSPVARSMSTHDAVDWAPQAQVQVWVVED
jgi:hypothetical protein